MNRCLVCKNNVDTIMSFGRMPIANGFLNPDQFQDEYHFELRIGFCRKCHMVQLLEQPSREMMFHDDYAFFSSTSSYMKQHFKEFSDIIGKQYVEDSDPFVIELGSNDGIMLRNFAESGIRHLGIEPSANVAQVAIKNGVQTISEFFDETLAKQIVRKHGFADAILAANVMCHIPYLHSVAAGIKILLKPDGVFVFEDPYLGDILEKTAYDQIYDEHAFYFSLGSITNLFEPHDLEIIDVIPQQVHGGSMRYVISHKGKKNVSKAVTELRETEETLGLYSFETFDKFRKSVETSQKQLVDLLENLHKNEKRVVGYAATSKSTTVTNFCGLTPDLIEYISDTTPIKQGKFSPGAHIPIKRYEAFCDDYPDYALLFAWNHADEIMAKEKEFIESGGKWIVFVPKVQIIE